MGILSPHDQSHQAPIEIDFAKNVGPGPATLDIGVYNSFGARKKEGEKMAD